MAEEGNTLSFDRLVNIHGGNGSLLFYAKASYKLIGRAKHSQRQQGHCLYCAPEDFGSHVNSQ